VDGDAITDDGSLVENHLRIEAAVFADLRIISDVISSQEHGARPDLDPLADDAMRADVRARINRCGGGDSGAGIRAG
jgi:hypothetical protein